ncbi:MAG: beta-glucosidase [Silvibacterium sp.]|nr:beta-glucosidase [Silvibacterium sp.]
MNHLFNSFFMGGFECSSHQRPHGRIDVIHATRHDIEAQIDYGLLAEVGIRTVRDALRWHLIEQTPGVYDWSSFLPMLQAALATKIQVIWDLCHWGVPDGLDPFSTEFVPRFERFCRAAAAIVGDHTDEPPFFCPINEISFWSFIGGDRGAFYPYAKRRGVPLKRRLVEATLAAIRAIRSVTPEARFIQCEPIIHISGSHRRPASFEEAARHTASQFEAWDMLCGRLAPELGGDESCLDLIGCNYYWNNQWVHKSHVTPIGHPQHRALHQILIDVYRRYERPTLIAETGAEADSAIGWLGMVSSEARQAMRAGVDLRGICLYPVMDYPGWEDNRHCEVGLIATDSEFRSRSIRRDQSEELMLQMQLFGDMEPVSQTHN